ncbi:MAG TPA: APC family permease [Labilithrix sp.]|nr:APC family permease [Labilithrix sp.]
MSEHGLERRIGLVQATSTNMLNMIGIGPFITIPAILGTMGGPQALLGWVLGALIAICDGLVWAELGAAMPGAGGPYVYLREAFGPEKLGRLMSFLYIWQTMVSAPLSTASGAVGFAQYTRYFFPGIAPWQIQLVAALTCLGVTALLYRDIRSVGRLSVILWVVVIGTALWIVIAGLVNFDPRQAFDVPADAFTRPGALTGLGSATLIAMYSYGGYFNVCLFGSEVKDPARTIPRSILIAIVAVAVLYVTMSVTIIGVVPWEEAMKTTSVVSLFIERIHGPWAGKLVTILILWTSLGSVFAILLGYSRVPYAAATDGRFFAPFAKLHPTRGFPYVSLLTLGVGSAVACWFDLEELIKALLVIQILIQFLSQVVAVTLVRKLRKDVKRPFEMWLYPVPSLIAGAGWLYILYSSGLTFVLAGVALMGVGALSYFVRARTSGEWPFAKAEAAGSARPK